MRQFITIAAALFEAARPPDHGIEGLPDHVRFRERQLKQAIERGGRSVFRAVATPGDKPDHYAIALHPAQPGKAQRYEPRPGRSRAAYYDPELADLHTFDKDVEYLEHRVPKAKPHLTTEFEGLPGRSVTYRGMSADEYEDVRKRHEVRSRGDYNFDNQEGLTYWTTEPGSARSYANGFAPMQWKPTIGHPCYIVAAPLAHGSDVRRVPGTGEHEVGVTRAITDDEILGVWRGQVFDHDAEAYELRPRDYGDEIDRAVDDGDTHRARYGGYRAQVVWDRIR